MNEYHLKKYMLVLRFYYNYTLLTFILCGLPQTPRRLRTPRTARDHRRRYLHKNARTHALIDRDYTEVPPAKLPATSDQLLATRRPCSLRVLNYILSGLNWRVFRLRVGIKVFQWMFRVGVFFLVFVEWIFCFLVLWRDLKAVIVLKR